MGSPFLYLIVEGSPWLANAIRSLAPNPRPRNSTACAVRAMCLPECKLRLMQNFWQRYFARQNWNTLIAWSPLLWFVVLIIVRMNISVHLLCHLDDSGEMICGGRYTDPSVTNFFWRAKYVTFALFILATVSAIRRKFTRTGWLGYALSFALTIFHLAVIVD